LFVDELARLQPTPGYMRLVKERVVDVWDQLGSEIKDGRRTLNGQPETAAR
jgi:hypothetical protein